jgi:hypothetical protein
VLKGWRIAKKPGIGTNRYGPMGFPVRQNDQEKGLAISLMSLPKNAEIVVTEHGKVCVQLVRSRWRIYEVIESDGFVRKGKALRRDDKPVAFWTRRAAIEYIKESVKP